MGRAIPVEAEDLDPSWLTEVLRVHAPDVEVVAAHVVDAHSGTTGRVRLRLEYAGSHEDGPNTVFCKIAPFEPRQRAFLRQIGIGAMEARFYAEIAPSVERVRFPRVWHAEADEDGDFVMIL